MKREINRILEQKGTDLFSPPIIVMRVKLSQGSMFEGAREVWQ